MPTNTELALQAISEDLDQHTQLLAEQATAHAALLNLVGETRRDLEEIKSGVAEILRIVRPLADRINEVDELRGRVARLELKAAAE